jgi:hypothetical protein
MDALRLRFFAPCLALLTSCSSSKTGDSDAATCHAFVSDAGLSETISFAADVVPIFQTNCTGGGFGCHGTDDNTPYLGDADGGSDPSDLLASIVGVLSPEDPLMDLVAAGDPANSYLMHKMDGDQCTLAAGCMQSRFGYLTDCGNNMPNGGATLPLATRDMVRAWIAQGATNN